jgi:hypothetical protein
MRPFGAVSRFAKPLLQGGFVVSSGNGDEFAAGASHDSLQVANELFIQRIIGRLECL